MTIAISSEGTSVRVDIPDGWIELRSDRTLREGDQVYNWKEKQFFDLDWWHQYTEMRKKLNGSTTISLKVGVRVSTAFAIRKISGFFDKPKEEVKPKNIKRLNNKEFLNKMRELTEE